MPRHILFLILLVAVDIIAMLGDKLRWQPWAYQFLFIFLAVVINAKSPRRAINSIIFVLASTYFFSGVFKCNGSFLYFVWYGLIVKKLFHFSGSLHHYSFILYAGLIVPAIEMACGIFLLLPKNYKLTRWLPISIHLFIILCFSPFGLAYDYIVFPWNLALLVITCLLFSKNKTVFSLRDMGYKSNAIVACALFLLPLAGMFDYWPPFFSFKLYTARHASMSVFISDTANIPLDIKPYIRTSQKGYQDLHTYFRPFDWCQGELNVPIPPDENIYKSLQDSLEKRYGAMKPKFVYR